MSRSKSKRSRREFLATSAGLSLGFTIVPRHVLGGQGQTPPSERINVAGIGCGGMGGGDIATVSKLGANMVALCDVDEARAGGTFNAHPKARRYKDFRQMLDKEAKHIDAVTVGTPDHVHAVAAMAAIRAGKHVYVQKPLTHTLFECRELTKGAKKAGVITSMGNQGHASEGARLTCEWIQAGVIGDVREVHVWSDRAGRLWKQGIGRPAESQPVPSTLDWNLWLGPIKERPYHSAYAPVGWRGWWDFGTGALGDMGCHIIDHPVWALKLGAPTSVEARATLDGTLLDGNKLNFETYPVAAIIYYEFPARGNLPAVKMTWYDGGLMPPAPAELPAGQRLPDNGVLYVGSKGKMYHSSHGGMPQLLPGELTEAAKAVPKSMERSPGHYEEWVSGCKSGKQPVASFEYSGPMTETVLLGVLSLRSPGRRLEWDGENQKVNSAAELNQYVHTEYRKGWTL
ncbi:MAG TPA: Gfo/Idh/MocA family oxidoreductase [Pirellulaceae bacterium]|nr:Gfo/Idh/MocA family oxidoreductase [Pirellulaceae bacterium]